MSACDDNIFDCLVTPRVISWTQPKLDRVRQWCVSACLFSRRLDNALDELLTRIVIGGVKEDKNE